VLVLHSVAETLTNNWYHKPSCKWYNCKNLLIYFILFTSQSEPCRTGRGLQYPEGADKSLARPGRKQAVPVKSVTGREWIDGARVGIGGGLL